MNLGRIEQYHNPNEGREIINSAFEIIEQTTISGVSSTITAATLDNLSVSAATSLNILSATTIFSGGTNLYDILSGTTGNPGGNDTEVQFNNAGSFSGSPYFKYLSASKSLNVGITDVSGTTNIGFNLENLNGSIKVGGDDTNAFGASLLSSYVGNIFQPTLLFLKASGTIASPSPVTNESTLASIIFGGYNGSEWKIADASAIRVRPVRNWSTEETATKMELLIIPSGCTIHEQILTLSDNGNGIFKYGITVGDLLSSQTPTVGTIRYASNKLQGYESTGWFNLNQNEFWTTGTGTGSIVSVSPLFPNIASGNYSISQGEYSMASGNFSNAMGLGVTATTTGAHAEGSINIASGYASHSQNYHTAAIGDSSHAGGYGYGIQYLVVASGNSSFNHSTTESGQTSVAAGNYSAILGGKNNSTTAEGSVILGCSGVTATTNYTTYVERFNIHTTSSPASGATGDIGTFTWDDDYLYIKTNKNGGRWGRIPIEYDF